MCETLVIINKPSLAFQIYYFSSIITNNTQKIYRRYTDSPIQIRCWYDANPEQVLRKKNQESSLINEMSPRCLGRIEDQRS